MKAWKLLADENLEAGIVLALRSAGHDVRAVAETEPRAADHDVLDMARRQGRVVLTNDKDFAELTFLQGRASHGIILLRMPRLRAASKSARVIDELSGRSPELGRAMLVIDEAAARARPFYVGKGAGRTRRPGS